MTKGSLRSLFRDVPRFSIREWENLYKFVRAWKPRSCLDLGFGHGSSALCMAAACAEYNDSVPVLAIDDRQALASHPGLERLRSRTESGLPNLTMYVGDSVELPVLEILDAFDGKQFDMIHVQPTRAWIDDELITTLIERFLSPGGWLIYADAPFEFISAWEHHPEWLHRLRMPPREIVQSERIYALLKEQRINLKECRRQGKRFFVRKSDDNSIQNGSSYDLRRTDWLICDLLFRASNDPDFRFDLLWYPERVFGGIDGHVPENFNTLTFKEAEEEAALGREFDSSQNCYRLNEPAWSNRFPRTRLIEMAAGGRNLRPYHHNPEKKTRHYDRLISLGRHCQTAHQIRRFTKNKTANYFDWLRTPHEGIIKTLRENFARSFELENLTLAHDPTIVLDTLTGLGFRHSFSKIPGGENIDPQAIAIEYGAQRDRMNFLLGRWRTVLKSESVLFVRQDTPTHAQVMDLYAALQDQVSSFFELLIVVPFGHELSVEHPHIHVERGNALPLGRGDWMGSDEIWDGILSKFI